MQRGQQHVRQEIMGQVIGDPHGVEPVAGGIVFVDKDAGIVDLRGGVGEKGGSGLHVQATLQQARNGPRTKKSILG